MCFPAGGRVRAARRGICSMQAPRNEQTTVTERCSGQAHAHVRACCAAPRTPLLAFTGQRAVTLHLPLAFPAFVQQSGKVCCDGCAGGLRHRVWRGKDGARWRRANQPRSLSGLAQDRSKRTAAGKKMSVAAHVGATLLVRVASWSSSPADGRPFIINRQGPVSAPPKRFETAELLQPPHRLRACQAPFATSGWLRRRACLLHGAAAVPRRML
jgi:hypothetical protein